MVKSKETWREKVGKIRKNITVEPILAAYIMPSVLSNLATQNLNLDKACRVNMNYDDVVCDSLIRRETANYTMQEETTQTMVAQMLAWKTVVQSIFPCLLILFWGSWSDRYHRRKPCILIPIVGEMLGSFGLMLCVFFERTPLEVAGFTEAIFPSLGGGWFVVLMGAFSYIADITTEEERTFRVGILNVCFSVGFPIGTALSGVLLKKFGYYGVYSVSASLYVFCLVYGIFFLEESRNRSIQPTTNEAPKSLLRDFFNMEHVLETFRVAYKKGENKRRIRVILLMLLVVIIIGPIYGYLNVMYLFARYRFNWDEVDYSMFFTFSVCTGLIGVLLSVGVLSHKFKIDDAIIGVISCVSKILSAFIYAFAYVPWHMYFGGIVELFTDTAAISLRSMASKLVSPDELGKVNSLFGVVEALMPMVYGPMFSTLYAATIKVFPGAFYILGAGIGMMGVIIFLWLYNFQRQLRERKHSAPEAFKDPNGIDKTTDVSLATITKENLIGTVSTDLQDHMCDNKCHIDKCLHAISNGIDSPAYIPDVVNNANTKSEPNTHIKTK